MAGDWFDDGGSGSAVDVKALLDSGCIDMLHELVALGALVSMGKTSDGGALAITVTVDGRWRREYFRDAEAMSAWCEEAMAPVADACRVKDASSASRSRPRTTRGR